MREPAEIVDDLERRSELRRAQSGRSGTATPTTDGPSTRTNPPSWPVPATSDPPLMTSVRDPSGSTGPDPAASRSAPAMASWSGLWRHAAGRPRAPDRTCARERHRPGRDGAGPRAGAVTRLRSPAESDIRRRAHDVHRHGRLAGTVRLQRGVYFRGSHSSHKRHARDTNPRGARSHCAGGIRGHASR
jgi:hypothetical protein